MKYKFEEIALDIAHRWPKEKFADFIYDILSLIKSGGNFETEYRDWIEEIQQVIQEIENEN